MQSINTRMGRTRNAFKIIGGRHAMVIPLGRIILKYILIKYGTSVWSEFMYLRVKSQILVAQ